MNAITQARDAAVRMERLRMQKLLDAAIADKIRLLDLVERALAQLRRGKTDQVRMFLERAVTEIKIDDAIRSGGLDPARVASASEGG